MLKPRKMEMCFVFPLLILYYFLGDATVTICHRHTPQELLTQCTQSADIIISGTGVPNLITGDMVKEGAAVIDVGFSRVYHHGRGKSQLVGDVDFQGTAV